VSEWKRFHSLTLVATAETSTTGLGTWVALSAHIGRPDVPGGRISDFFSLTGGTPVPRGMGVSPLSEHGNAP
jgi:hypothetical protein